MVRLRAAAAKRIDVIELAAGSRVDVDALHARVLAAGCREIFAPRALRGHGGGYGFRFFSPGWAAHLAFPAEVARRRKHARSTRSIRTRAHQPRRAGTRPTTRPQVEFFTDVLGFRISDWLGKFMCFLRCNEWHHRIAILPGPPCLNHVAYDMRSLDAMMRGVGAPAKVSDIALGPGAHKAGNNTFSYFVTPNGFSVEYTAELERVDEAPGRARCTNPSPRLMDLWGIGVGWAGKRCRILPGKGLFQPVGDLRHGPVPVFPGNYVWNSAATWRWRAATRSARSKTCAASARGRRAAARTPARPSSSRNG